MLNLPNPLIKVLLPALGIAVTYFIATKRLKYSLRDDLLMVAPNGKSLLFWILIYLAYISGTDWLFNWRGAWNFQVWREQTLLTSVARVLAVGILGPVAEEMIFRGLLLKRMNQLTLNKWISLIMVTVAWTVIHVDYSIEILVLIFFNGILLGLSLYASRSLLVPVVLHIIWNLYAVW